MVSSVAAAAFARVTCERRARHPLGPIGPRYGSHPPRPHPLPSKIGAKALGCCCYSRPLDEVCACSPVPLKMVDGGNGCIVDVPDYVRTFRRGAKADRPLYIFASRCGSVRNGSDPIQRPLDPEMSAGAWAAYRLMIAQSNGGRKVKFIVFSLALLVTQTSPQSVAARVLAVCGASIGKARYLAEPNWVDDRISTGSFSIIADGKGNPNLLFKDATGATTDAAADGATIVFTFTTKDMSKFGIVVVYETTGIVETYNFIGASEGGTLMWTTNKAGLVGVAKVAAFTSRCDTQDRIYKRSR